MVYELERIRVVRRADNQELHNQDLTFMLSFHRVND